VIDLDVIDPEIFPKDLVSEKLIQKHRVLPLYKRGTRLFVVVSDPTDIEAIDEIKFNTGLTTEALLAEDDKLQKTIDRFLESQDTSLQEMGDSDLEDLDLESG